MTDVHVTFSFTTPQKVSAMAGIDGKALTFDTNRTATMSEKKGTHTLQWSIHGPPGTKYTIGITAPPEAAFFSYTDTLGAEGVDSGFQNFPVNS